MKELTDGNFNLYAAKYYINVNCVDEEEFQEDLNRIKYIKRLFTRYKDSGNIKPQLVINHLVILYNVFETRPLTTMLLFRLAEHVDLLKPFLLYLNFWPSDAILDDSKIVVNEGIVKRLEEFDARI